MWCPKRLIANRFMAYEAIDYNFLEEHSVMIQGKNLTDDGQDSNGACKSALLEAVGVLLTGKCIRLDTSAKELVMHGEKSSYLEFTLENPVLKQVITIKRELFSNTKSATLEIEFNEEPMSDITSVNEGNDRILELLGIERDDLLNYYLISKERYVPFYKLPDSKKKAVIGRFSNSDMIAPIEGELDENIAAVQEVINDIMNTIERHNIKIETYANDMDSFSVEEMQEKRDAKVKSLKESIEDYEDKIEAEEEKQKGWESDLNEHEERGKDMSQEFPDNTEERTEANEELEQKLKGKKKKFDKKRDEDIQKLDDDRKKRLADIDSTEAGLNDELTNEKEGLAGAEKLQAKVAKGIMESVECPKCQHEFSPADKKLNIEAAKKRKDEVDEVVKDIEGVVQEIKDDINALDDKRQEVRDDIKSKKKEVEDQYEEDVKDINADLDKVDQEYDEIKAYKKQLKEMWGEWDEKKEELEEDTRLSVNRVKGFNREITSLNEEIKAVEDQVIKDRKAEFKTQIKELEDQIKEEEKSLEIEQEKLQKAEEEKALFIRFKTHLSNKAIGAIEAHSNDYLEIAKSNIRVQIDGYRETKAGDIREKITTSVLRDGISEGGIGKFSSGEKARIEVANILALKKMINSSSPTGGLDLLILDEVTNSLDSSGTMGVLEMLEETGETSILITHSTFHSMYPYIQTVVKEDGISTIIDGEYKD